MWDGFIAVAKELMPNAIIVIDRFHVVSHLHKAINYYRKKLRKEFPDEESFKKLRWLLLKNSNDLTDEEKKQLEKAFSICPELEQIYQLKENFKSIFDADVDKETGKKLLDIWKEQANELKNKYLDRFLKTLESWEDGILNFFIHRNSNGIAEGINNFIKFIKRKAFGFRNFDNFKRWVMVSYNY